MEEINTQEIEGLKGEANSIIVRANTLQIVMPDDYSRAGEDIKIIKLLSDRTEEKRKEITRHLDESKKRIIALFKPIMDTLELARQKIDRAMLSYDQEQERKRQAEQAKLDEKARIEREKALAKAEELRAQGKTEKAEALEQKAETTIAPVVVINTPKIDGLRKRMDLWRWRLKVPVDKISLEDFQKYFIPNKILLDDIAASSKGTFVIKCFEFYSEKSNI
jgi:hypothetical protein